VAIEAIAQFCAKNEIDTRKLKIIEIMPDSAIITHQGEKYRVDANGSTRIENEQLSDFDAWARIYCAPQHAGVSPSGQWVVTNKAQKISEIVVAKTARAALEDRPDYEHCQIVAYEKFNDFGQLDVPF